LPRPGDDGKVDIGAHESSDEYLPGPTTDTPRVLHVRAGSTKAGNGLSWTTAFPSITAALNVAGTSDELWVAAGRYLESVAMERTVAMYGGFLGIEAARDARDWIANETIIDATGLQTHAVTAADMTILDGFTITGGNSLLYGGGVYCDRSSPTLRNCIIKGNSSVGSGGGVWGYECSPTLTNCMITANTATGEYGNGGGICCYIRCSPTLTNCTITGNTAAKKGGGVYCSSYVSAAFLNCTITGNRAATTGGFYWNHAETPTLTNCILWNFGEEFSGYSVGRPIVSYSCVEGGWEGVGNIDATPGFVHPWDGEWADLHLLHNSPCIDVGRRMPSVTNDLDGLPRPYDVPNIGFDGDGQGYDMGAYEYHPPDYQTPTPTMTPTPTPTIPIKDIYCDGFYGHAELVTFLNSWHSTEPRLLNVFEIDNNGIVDSNDLYDYVKHWNPPRFVESVTLLPENPNTSDTIICRMEGFCPGMNFSSPEPEEIAVYKGDGGSISASLIFTKPCGEQIEGLRTPFDPIEKEIGTLPAGDYTLRIYANGTLQAKSEFSVATP